MLPHHQNLNDNVWPSPESASASPIPGDSKQNSCSPRKPRSFSGEASHGELQQLTTGAVSDQGPSSPGLPVPGQLCPEVQWSTHGKFNVLDKTSSHEEENFKSANSQIPNSEPRSTESPICGAHGSVCRSSGCLGGHHNDGGDANGSSYGGSTSVNNTNLIDSIPANEAPLNGKTMLNLNLGDSLEKEHLEADNISAGPSCSSNLQEFLTTNVSENKISVSSKSCKSNSTGKDTLASSFIKSSAPHEKPEMLSNFCVDPTPSSSAVQLPVENFSKLSKMGSVSERKNTEPSSSPLMNKNGSSPVEILNSGCSTETISPSSSCSSQPTSPLSEQGSDLNVDRPTTAEQGTSTDRPQGTSELGSPSSASDQPPPNDASPRQAQQPDVGAEGHNAAGFPNVRMAVPTNLNQLRERMFRSLFLRASVAYARSTTPFIRRLLEFILLIKSLGCLFLLMLVHLYLCNQSPACLPTDTEWDKTGILRVEVIPSPDPSYSLARSYQKEELLHRRYTMDGGTIIFTAMEEFNKVSDSVLLDETIIPDWKTDSASKPLPATDDDEEAPELSWAEHVSASVREMSSPFFSPFAMGVLSLLYDGGQRPRLNSKGATNGSSEGIAPSCSAADAPNPLVPATTCPALPDFVQEEEEVYFYMSEDAFIMEYALDYGLLRLSAATRKRLGVAVTLVVLDPNTNPCFGDSFSTFLLSNLVGYDELLLAAVKTLAEQDGGKGYLRNVVTGEHYRFVSTWLGGTNYVGAGLVMVVFTLSVSLLLRYSHHQIFLFIVHLLHMMEINATAVASFPAAPMLTVILALVGMEAIMSEFFKDTTTAFYIIVMVWVCDQYETLCCTQPITRKHWLRFFYLYHFAFYAYHYRFNGQYSWLALMTSWFFLQHSMLYFYHHYELPAMLRSRPRLQAVNIVMRRPPAGAEAAGTGTASTGAGAAAGASNGSAGSSNASTSGTNASTSGASGSTLASSGSASDASDTATPVSAGPAAADARAPCELTLPGAASGCEAAAPPEAPHSHGPCSEPQEVSLCQSLVSNSGAPNSSHECALNSERAPEKGETLSSASGSSEISATDAATRVPSFSQGCADGCSSSIDSASSSHLAFDGGNSCAERMPAPSCTLSPFVCATSTVSVSPTAASAACPAAHTAAVTSAEDTSNLTVVTAPAACPAHDSVRCSLSHTQPSPASVASAAHHSAR